MRLNKEISKLAVTCKQTFSILSSLLMISYMISYHECEGRKEKSVPRITLSACRVMTNGDPEAWFFLSHPHTNK